MNKQKVLLKKWGFRTLVILGMFFLIQNSFAATKAKPDPSTNELTYTLPDNASPIRLSLPAKINKIFYGPKTGLVGFGLHAGGHIEGLDHVWIELKHGTPLKSWADGQVLDIRQNGEELHIVIDYGKKLRGTHMEVLTSYVKKGQKVKRGQKIGLGMSFDPDQSSAEFALEDSGRTDGVFVDTGYLVSPYDYLLPSEKTKLVKAYNKYILKPYLQTGIDDSTLFEPYEPKLTNRIDLSKRKKGKILGVWYSLKKWKPIYPNDILTFLSSNTKYYKGTRVFGTDDESEGGISDWSINGTYEVNYNTNQLHIINNDNGKEYFGIFKIKDWKNGRQKLTIEYQEGSYPAVFSANALKYASRTNVSRRVDAVLLGVRKTF